MGAFDFTAAECNISMAAAYDDGHCAVAKLIAAMGERAKVGTNHLFVPKKN